MVVGVFVFVVVGGLGFGIVEECLVCVGVVEGVGVLGGDGREGE